MSDQFGGSGESVFGDGHTTDDHTFPASIESPSCNTLASRPDMAFLVSSLGVVRCEFSPSMAHLRKTETTKSICILLRKLWTGQQELQVPNVKTQAASPKQLKAGSQDREVVNRSSCAKERWSTCLESTKGSCADRSQVVKKRKSLTSGAANYHVSLTYSDDNSYRYDEQESEEEDSEDEEEEEEQTPDPVPCRPQKWLRIDNSKAMYAYYQSRFEAMQQTSCRTVSKAWIRVIHPKKQSKNAYIKGEITKPGWWPFDVEHKEPDHLKKIGRIKLLLHILKNLSNQSENPLSPKNITVEKLTKGTPDLENTLLRDPKNGAKAWGLLCEIYQMRRHEEKYENGEIDGAEQQSYYELPKSRSKSKPKPKSVLKKRKRPRAITPPASPTTPAVPSPEQSTRALVSPIERLALDTRSSFDNQTGSFDSTMATQTSLAFEGHINYDRKPLARRSAASSQSLSPSMTSHSPSRLEAAFSLRHNDMTRHTQPSLASSSTPALVDQSLNTSASGIHPAPLPLGYPAYQEDNIQWSQIPQNPNWQYDPQMFHGLPMPHQVSVEQQSSLLSAELMAFSTPTLVHQQRIQMRPPAQYQQSSVQPLSSQSLQHHFLPYQSQETPFQ